MNLIAEMAALGLPTSFVSRSNIHEKGVKKSRGTPSDKSNGPEDATEAKPTPPVLFRAVELFSTKDPALEEITLDRLRGLEYQCPAVEAETLLADIKTSLLHESYRLNDVELGKSAERLNARQVTAELEVAKVTENRFTWEPIWDEQYQRYYFCNTETWESTWDPPLGYEHYGLNSAESIECSTDGQSQLPESFDPSFIDKSSSEDGYGVWSSSRMARIASCSVDNVEAFEGHADHASAFMLHGELDELDGFERADTQEVSPVDGNQGLNPLEGHNLRKVVIGGKSKMVEVEQSSSVVSKTLTAAPAIFNVILEEVICRESEFESSTMANGDSNSAESSPTFSPACGSHIRFCDSDESSETGDYEGVNWSEIEVKQSVVTASDGRQVEVDACSLSLDNETSTAVRRYVPLPREGSRRRRVQSFSESEKLEKVLLPGMAEVMSKSLIKYWLQRYSLFSRYDEGIKLDEEGWFSVTPEAIAAHHAFRCPEGIVVDAFTGVGGNAIQFALNKNNYVIAIEINPARLELARHNAEIYGVSDRIEFILGDFFLLAPLIKADFVFLSPPWGGPEYLNKEKYNIETMLQPKDGYTLFKIAKTIAPNVALFLPRNVDLIQLQELSWLTSPPLPCEIELNQVDNRVKAITAYYGEVAGQMSTHESSSRVATGS